MTLRDALRFAASGLWGSPLRTLLTVLGMGVGAAAVLTVLTLGSDGQSRVEQEIARLGVDMVWISAEDPTHALAGEDALLIMERVGLPACAGAWTAGAVSMNGTVASAQIAGYDEQVSAVHSLSSVEGRLLSSSDHMQRRAVCLIDEVLADSLGTEVTGQWLRVNGRRLRIVGVVRGMATQAMGAGLVMLPLNTYEDTFGSGVTEITLCVPAGMRAELLAEQALDAMPQRSGYRAATLEEEIDAAREVIRIFIMVLACVAAVCMISGAIGVMNVLLVSVRERRREIGLLKALGASSVQVGLLFLLEAAAYAAAGGVLGLLLGAGMIRLCGLWIGLEAQMTLGQALPVLAGTALTGVIFGVAPALRAAGMTPVEALRSE